MKIRTLWHRYSDRNYLVGPFYFCSEKCRDEWEADRKANEPKLTGCEKVEEDKPREYGCDMCGLKFLGN